MKLSESIGLVFPGQGSQSVGMGQAIFDKFPQARSLIEEMEAAVQGQLPKPITALIMEGPEELLHDTANTQPALYAVSLVYYEVLQQQMHEGHLPGMNADPTGQPEITAVAGHSLGQYAALAAAGAISYQDGFQLVMERGRLMKAAGEQAEGGMAAVIGMDHASIEAVCEEASQLGLITPANVNSPGQVVISGETKPLEAAIQMLDERGAKRVIPLKVSIAAHSEAMAPVAEAFAEVVNGTEIKPPRIPVIDNITAEPLYSASEIRQSLVDHLRKPVLWTQSVTQMTEMGITHFYEVGPGNVLSRLIQRTLDGIETTSMDRIDWK